MRLVPEPVSDARRRFGEQWRVGSGDRRRGCIGYRRDLHPVIDAVGASLSGGVPVIDARAASVSGGVCIR